MKVCTLTLDVEYDEGVTDPEAVEEALSVLLNTALSTLAAANSGANPGPYPGHARTQVMAWSPYKSSVIAYVSAHPGCSKWDVASHCTHSARRCPSKQYYIVNTALRNGWIVGKQRGRQYRLYVPTDESETKVSERAAGRRMPCTPSLAERLAQYKHTQRLAALRAQGWQVDTIRHSRMDSSGYFDCTVKVDADLWLSFRSVPSVAEVMARIAEVQASQVAEQQRRDEEYRRMVEGSMPQGRIRFNSEGGFSVN